MTLWQIIFNIVLIINVILIGGVLPLIERKYLSLIQRRVGPKHVGYKGRLQFIADALKMFLKGLIVPTKLNSVFFIFWPVFFLIICLLLFINGFWGNNIIFLEIEYNLLYLSIVSIFLNVCVFFTGFFSQNKYAILSSSRTLIFFFILELLLAIFFFILIFFIKSFNLSILQPLQEEYVLLISFFFIVNHLIMIFMMEICKSPFDLNEAETELVTGYHTEYGAFFFALFYLGEYFHLFFTALFLSLVFFGF